VSGRAERMARRLDRDARRRGVAPDAAADLVAAFRLAMEPRLARIHNDHHPDYLHTARTALILIEDAGLTDRAVLCAAALCETRDTRLAVRPGPELGEEVARLLEEVPDPAGARLLEALVTASPGAQLVAVAERLDHARHLHLRPEPEWRPYHATTCDVYAAVARRVSPPLADRFHYWCATFRERFLGGGGPEGTGS